MVAKVSDTSVVIEKKNNATVACPGVMFSGIVTPEIISTANITTIRLIANISQREIFITGEKL